MRTRTLKPTPAMIAEASTWLIEFRTGAPTQAERDRFNAWLCTSPQHIQAYLEVAAAWSELPDRDPDGRIDIENMIRAAREATAANVVQLSVGARPERPRARARFSARAIAASLAVLCVGALSAFLYTQRDSYTTGTGEQRSLTLADGSTIELNARTTVRVRYGDTERRIELIRGQALFHVAKNSARPFIVRTGATQVRAVGTQFDVYRRASGTVVTVVEGRVEVSGGVAASELLAAGEQLTVVSKAATDAAAPRPHPADIGAATAWTQKRLVFEDTPLADVAEEFNRYNLRPLVVADASLRQLGVSGLYSSTDPTALIKFLNSQPGIRVIESDTEIRITRQ